MSFAGPATIQIAGAFRKKAAEDAVLRMEDRQVMEEGGFDAFGANVASELSNLFRIKVMGRRQAAAALLQICCRGTCIRGVQAKVASEFMRGMFEAGKHASGADQDVAIQAEEKIEDLGFTWLEQSWGGDTESDVGSPDAGSGVAKAIKIKKIERNAGGGNGESGVQLSFRSDEQVDAWGNWRAESHRFRSGGWKRSVRGGALLFSFELVDSIAADLVQKRDGPERGAFCVERQGCELVSGAPQAAKLLAE